MEGAALGGRWNKKGPIGTFLLLVCLVVPAFPLLQDAVEKTCPRGDYLTEEGICCNKCPAGFKLVEKCHAVGQRSNCTHCPVGQYADQMNFSPNCRRCRQCKKDKHEIEESPCESRQNTICHCKEGYYKVRIDSGTSECWKCAQCGPDEKEKQPCSQTKNTVCGCKENYYRFNGKCEPCKNCTAECEHHCSLPTLNTKAPEPPHQLLINIIAGTAAVVFVLLVLVALITYITTKRLTNQQLNSSSQPSDASPDSCKEVLILCDEPLENSSVTAIPQNPVSQQEPSNLPDCVPLEIKIPDLIYMVLDLVPVPRVKQLVRSLGVKDTEIEQAEMDHRSCREAHYQMLRVWVERGTRAGGGGGQGGMLHRPLLQELLDTLRNMHLGQTAEELETKYGIQ